MEANNQYACKDSFENFVLNRLSVFEFNNIKSIMKLGNKNEFTWFLRNPEKSGSVQMIKDLSFIIHVPTMELVTKYKVGYKYLTAMDLEDLKLFDQSDQQFKR